MCYISPTELLDNAKNIKAPERLDCIDLFKEGVLFHVYGVLHGISGGTNADYRQFVNDSIKSAKGLKLGEKGMTHLYDGLDGELEDWGAVPYPDIVKLTLAIHALPWRSFKFIKTLIIEKLRNNDKFKTKPTINNLGGSRYFHLIDPFERRRLAGFPQSTEYLHINLERRHGKKVDFKLPTVFDKDWTWLNWIEPYANLPLRSIFMIEYACELAKLSGIKEVSLFVGETHNTDIATYLELINLPTPLPYSPEAHLHDWRYDFIVMDTVSDARDTALRVHNHIQNPKRFEYLSGILVGMSLPFSIYLLIALELKKYFNGL